MTTKNMPEPVPAVMPQYKRGVGFAKSPTTENPELQKMRHSYAHVMAMAVKRRFPDAKATIGPDTATGFFYDFDREKPFTPQDLVDIEKEMRSIIEVNLPFVRQELLREQMQSEILALEEPYKLKLLDAIPVGESISRYSIGIPNQSDPPFWDLCRGPHVESTGDLDPDAFELTGVSGSYWRGNEKNPALQRIYGVAFENSEQLATYKLQQEEAKRRDHRKIGKEMRLFSIQDEAGGGLVFWHPHGAIMRHLIQEAWIKMHLQNGYELVSTPHMASLDLWVASGHNDFYRESMFQPMEVEGQAYQIKPMNCPFHVLIYKDTLHSYRELPLRWAELGTVYRYERSGTMHGLMRVRGFTQDDAHIFCTEVQMHAEILGVLDLAELMLSTFGFENYEIYLSTRPDKYVGSEEIWDKATDALTQALERKGWDYAIDQGGGAFYGPKIDIKIQDAIGRSWQCSTIQVDFNLPDRFDMEYVGEDGNRHRPIMIHRALFGSLERFFGILIEHYAGDFPLWLAPVQARILTVSEEQIPFAKQVQSQMRSLDLRVEIDISGERLSKKIRDAEQDKIPVILVVGSKETQSNTLSVRTRASGELGVMAVSDTINKMLLAIQTHGSF